MRRRRVSWGLGIGGGMAFLLWGVLGGAWGVVGCEGEKGLGVKVQGQLLDAIDMHLHPGQWKDIPPETQRFIGSRFPFPLNLDPAGVAEGILSAEGIVSEMTKAGVRGGVFFAVYAPKTVGIAPNDFVIEQIAKYPDRLVGLASLRVDRWREEKTQQIEAMRKALEHPQMVGIKLAHAHMHFRMDDPGYYGIYEIAATMKKPLYLHTGSSPFPGIAQEPEYTDPSYLEDAIQKHPGAIFILGHLGYDFIEKKHGTLEACLRLAKTYKNVYLEPSALGSEGGDPTGANLALAMKRIKDEGLIDRVIYGSDGPQSPGFVKKYLERTLKAMESSGYSLPEIKAVLSENFVRIFAPPFGKAAQR